MAKAQITAVLKAHDSTGIARYTWTMYPGHNAQYCLEEKRFEKYFNRSIRTCSHRAKVRARCQHLVPVCINYCFCFFLSLSHRPMPPGFDETGGQQDISLYELQDSRLQGSTTVYLTFPLFAFHFRKVDTCRYMYFHPRRQNSKAPPPPPPHTHTHISPLE